MRVIRGIYKGRTLKSPRGQKTRPTTDRVRESMFQVLETGWLEDGFTDRLIFDLYAGSGALGIEAISRGAGRVVFFESDVSAVRSIRHNLRELGVAEDQFELVTRPLPGSLMNHGSRVANAFHGVASVIFSDPPYDDDRQNDLASALHEHPAVASDAVWCHECSGGRSLITDPWRQIERRDYGDTSVRLMFRDEPAIDS